jgi:hypothetical protein
MYRYTANVKVKIKVILRPTVGRSVLVSGIHLGPMDRFLLLSNSSGCWCEAPTLTLEDWCVVYTAAGPRQRSHSWVRVPHDSWPYFIVWNLRLPQLGVPGPRIYILHEEGGPVIPPRHWVYEHGCSALLSCKWSRRFSLCNVGWIIQKTRFQQSPVVTDTFLPCRCLVMSIFYSSTLPTFSFVFVGSCWILFVVQGDMCSSQGLHCRLRNQRWRLCNTKRSFSVLDLGKIIAKLYNFLWTNTVFQT